MIETRLQDFYNKKLTSWNLIYKPFSVRYKTFKSIFLIITLIFMGLYLYTPFSTPRNNTISSSPFTYLVMFCLITGIYFLLFKNFVTSPAQDIAYKKYKIDVKSPYWNESISLIIKSYLFQNNILNNEAESNKKTLDFLIDIFQKKIDKLEKKGWATTLSTYGGLALLFIIPVWTAFNQWISNPKNEILKNGFQATSYLLAICFFIFIFIFCVWAPIRQGLLGMFSSELNNTQNLLRALENIRISLDNKKYNEQITSKAMQPKIIESIIQEYMADSEKQTNISPLSNNMFVADEIEKLATLKDKKIITDEEFIKQKEKLLN
ncbi:SHOCT domain-containing protein [Bacillus toyonensis]|uniref:SHOCT domain-containing protein n=1 Tax=Bacillus toyonensis TaxID=155322 RepID=UPI0034659343